MKPSVINNNNGTNGRPQQQQQPNYPPQSPSHYQQQPMNYQQHPSADPNNNSSGIRNQDYRDFVHPTMSVGIWLHVTIFIILGGVR